MRRGCRVPLGSAVPAPGSTTRSGESEGGWLDFLFGDEAEAPKGGGTPGPTGFRPGNWDFERGEYTIAYGDTMWGLATQYLGQGSRWLDIWQMQGKPWGSKSPSGGPYLNRFYNKPDPSSKNPGRPFMEGDVLIMPALAVKNAKAMAQSDNESPLPTTPGAPGWQPGGGAKPEAKPQAATGISSTALLLGGAAVVGLVLLSK